VSSDLLPPTEARRLQGLAVPVVAALVVVGIGLPLTAIAVSQVGRLPATSSGPSSARNGSGPVTSALGLGGRAHLAGAITFDGPVFPGPCTAGPPRVVALDAGTARYSVVLRAPAGAGPGTYELTATSGAFVAVTREAGAPQTWSSIGQGGATGSLTVGSDGGVSARFRGLAAPAGAAAGTLEGSVEARCA